MCSGIRIICKDGTIIVARTLEFGFIFDYTVYNDDNILGITTDDYFLDGINKDGLCVMTFYFPQFDEYSDETPNGNISLMSLEVTGYLLQHAKNISDVENIIKKITVNKEIFKTFNSVVPVHWLCVDKTGKCIVIESVKGVLTSYKNNLGVMTNSPTFPFHLLTLEMYPEFSRYNNPEQNYSQGTGMNGLPGDFSSISRFVRLNLFQKLHDQPYNGVDGLSTTFHILNNFDIVKGYVESSEGSKEFTQYTVAYNLNDLNGWYKTYENQIVRNLVSKKILIFDREGQEDREGKQEFVLLRSIHPTNFVYNLVVFVLLVLIIVSAIYFYPLLLKG